MTGKVILGIYLLIQLPLMNWVTGVTDPVLDRIKLPIRPQSVYMIPFVAGFSLNGAADIESRGPPGHWLGYSEESPMINTLNLPRVSWNLQPPEIKESDEEPEGSGPIQAHKGFVKPKDIYRFLDPLSQMIDEEGARESIPKYT